MVANSFLQVLTPVEKGGKIKMAELLPRKCHFNLFLPGSPLVGYFGFNGPLSKYFSLYGAVSQRARKKREIDESKNVQIASTGTNFPYRETHKRVK